MKLNLAAVAIVLSLVSITLSLAQPTYNFLVSTNQTTGIPDFSVEQFDVVKTHTLVHIRNNGTATAHNVWVTLNFETQYLTPQWTTSENIPEIEPNNVSHNYLPIGTHQLKSTIPSDLWANYDSIVYEITVGIYCREIPEWAYSRFSYNVTIVNRSIDILPPR